jgi:AraC family transcriptional regulator of adaptative response/methylated-DNA-[protein]-cysteine methyltransferase
MGAVLLESTLDTPLGTMRVLSSDEGISMFDFPFRRMATPIYQRVTAGANVLGGKNEHTLLLEHQLALYFGGQLQSFSVPLAPVGTPFQQRVWAALLAIPFGSTATYMKQAIALGDPLAIRAVASANGANAIAILIPCHRVIGADGSLTGYGGGLPKKQFLLSHEGKFASQQSLF